MPAGFQVHVGTSGWHYKHWLGDFYPEKLAPAKMFPWYSREFHTVEINNSFYRLPEEKTFELFFSRAEPLGQALGPVLFQLPPRWKANIDRLVEFLSILPKRHKYAVEFRDESWCTPRVYDLLRSRNVALCIHDWREMPWPTELTADFTYIRFHGSGSCYGGNYPAERLRTWAELIRSWRPRIDHAFIYFNNDIGGHAIRNAKTLRRMLADEAVVKPAA